MPEEIALFIDFENIRYSMLNIQRREPDPQELIAVARRYGTVMVARAYADWSRQPEPFKGSLTAAMIDRVDCPAKQRDRIRMGTVHYPSASTPTGALGSSGLVTEQGTGAYTRQWPSGPLSHSGPLPAISASGAGNEWSGYNDSPESRQPEAVDSLLEDNEPQTEEGYVQEYQQREPTRQFLPSPPMVKPVPVAPPIPAAPALWGILPTHPRPRSCIRGTQVISQQLAQAVPILSCKARWCKVP